MKRAMNSSNLKSGIPLPKGGSDLSLLPFPLPVGEGGEPVGFTQDKLREPGEGDSRNAWDRLRAKRTFRLAFSRHAAACLVCLSAAILVPVALRAQETHPAPKPPRVFSVVADRGAFLGVSLKDVTAADVSSMKLPGEYGAIVTEVEAGSPAAKAGLRVNDVILEFGGMRVWSAGQLAQLVQETPPGRTVTLRVSRSGEKLNLEASLESRRESALMPRFQMPRINISPRAFNFSFVFPAKYRLGVEVETLTSQLASYFGVKQGKGVLVTEVEANGPAAKAGMKAGDCVVAADSAAVATPSDLTRALNNAKNSEITLSIVRSGREETLTAKLEPGWQPMMERQIEQQIDAARKEMQSAKEQMSHAREIERRMRRLNDRPSLLSPGVV